MTTKGIDKEKLIKPLFEDNEVDEGKRRH